MKLLDIPNIELKIVQAIKNSWQKHKNIKDLIIFLSDCGVSTTVAHKICKVYGEESIKKLKENPYQNFPPYEKLTNNLKEKYSRRINIKHRLVYEVLEEGKIVNILSIWTHYEF